MLPILSPTSGYTSERRHVVDKLRQSRDQKKGGDKTSQPRPLLPFGRGNSTEDDAMKELRKTANNKRRKSKQVRKAQPLELPINRRQNQHLLYCRIAAL